MYRQGHKGHTSCTITRLISLIRNRGRFLRGFLALFGVGSAPVPYLLARPFCGYTEVLSVDCCCLVARLGWYGRGKIASRIQWLRLWLAPLVELPLEFFVGAGKRLHSLL